VARHVFVDDADEELLEIDRTNANFNNDLGNFRVIVYGQDWRLLDLESFALDYEVVLRQLFYLVHAVCDTCDLVRVLAFLLDKFGHFGLEILNNVELRLIILVWCHPDAEFIVVEVLEVVEEVLYVLRIHFLLHFLYLDSRHDFLTNLNGFFDRCEVVLYAVGRQYHVVKLFKLLLQIITKLTTFLQLTTLGR
jgi:hypothetical protein